MNVLKKFNVRKYDRSRQKERKFADRVASVAFVGFNIFAVIYVRLVRKMN